MTTEALREIDAMVEPTLLTEDEWDAEVADLDDTFQNARIEDGHYVADFYVYASICTSDLADELTNGHLRRSLEEALHRHDLLQPVFVTTDADEAWDLLFFNLHFPMDEQAQTRLKKAAKVARAWLREKEDQ